MVFITRACWGFLGFLFFLLVFSLQWSLESKTRDMIYLCAQKSGVYEYICTPTQTHCWLQSVSINHAALRFISPQLHSGAQLASLFSKCGSRVHASRRLHGRACYFNTDGIKSSGIAHEFGGCTFGKNKFIKKKNATPRMQIVALGTMLHLYSL